MDAHLPSIGNDVYANNSRRGNPRLLSDERTDVIGYTLLSGSYVQIHHNKLIFVWYYNLCRDTQRPVTNHLRGEAPRANLSWMWVWKSGLS